MGISRKKAFVSEQPLAQDDMVLLWLLRLMAPLGGYKHLIKEHYFNEDGLAIALGLGRFLGANEETETSYKPSVVKGELFKIWQKAENRKSTFRHKDRELTRNVGALGAALGLSKAEKNILHFCISAQINELLPLGISAMGRLSIMNLQQILSVALELSVEDTRKSLLPSGALAMSGLITIDMSDKYEFCGKVELLDGLADEMHLHHNNPADILRDIIHASPKAKLNEADYPHFAHEIALASRYVEAAVATRKKGVNLLFYGVPGSGKTEFARMLAGKLDLELFEIASSNRSETPLDGDDRFRAYRLGQKLCERKNRSAILFDEVEDVFGCSFSHFELRTHTGKKCWVNHILEENPVPAFWITNRVDEIDAAYLRRFDLVLEFKSPPRGIRERMISSYLTDLPVSETWKKRMAEHETLVPALIERAARVIKEATPDATPADAEQSLEKIIGNIVEAMGYQRPQLSKNSWVTTYRPDILNTDQDIAALCNGLKQHRQARVCLFGPPGTGKTAFGKHVAEILDMPLIAKRASDIISPYVGMTEQNIADMFREAHDGNAVLLLDEADSFLQARQNARYSWEISFVNEMLTQMECFEGVFIASTNFMSALDPATLRRFDIKLKFDYLHPEQAWAMFLDLAKAQGFDACESLKPKIQVIENLAPGDFAVVSRKLRLTRASHPETLVEMLVDECKVKPDGRNRPIGF